MSQSKMSLTSYSEDHNSDPTETKFISIDPINSLAQSLKVISEESDGRSDAILVNLSSEDIFDIYLKLPREDRREINDLIMKKFFNSIHLDI